MPVIPALQRRDDCINCSLLLLAIGPLATGMFTEHFFVCLSAISDDCISVYFICATFAFCEYFYLYVSYFSMFFANYIFVEFLRFGKIGTYQYPSCDFHISVTVCYDFIPIDHFSRVT